MTTHDRILTHRTRNNTAAIRGLSSAIDQHCLAIRYALNNEAHGETQLQSIMADLMQDVLAIESLIVEQEQ